MSKPSSARYRTTNWTSYNASLRKRGVLLIWVDKDMTWRAPRDGRSGRPAIFSDAAIQFCLSIKVLFKLSLRQTAGMVASLLRLAGLDWPVPDFSTLCRRQKSLAVQVPYRRADGPLNLLVDSTGIKFLGDGEWQARKHGVQANALEAKIIKGSRSSVVVYYGTTERNRTSGVPDDETETDDPRIIPFMKSYRVFNADQIEGLDERFHPEPPHAQSHPQRAPIPHMQRFFEAIGATVSFTGREACYVPALDKIYMPPIELFDDPRNFYAVWGHELGHWTKPRHRLNRSYGDARFGNTAYAREEIVAELCTVFLGQRLGFSAHTLELNAAYLDNWLRVLRSDKRAIFKHAADAQKACDYLVAASEAGQGDQAA